MENAKKENICSACLHFGIKIKAVDDLNIKHLFKIISNDNKENVPVMLCWKCCYTFYKISKFRQICIQSQLFLNKHYHENQINTTLLNEEKRDVFNHLEISENFSLSISNKVKGESKNVINVIHDENDTIKLLEVKIKTEYKEDSDSDVPLSAYESEIKLDNNEIDMEKKKKVKKIKKEKFKADYKKEKLKEIIKTHDEDFEVDFIESPIINEGNDKKVAKLLEKVLEITLDKNEQLQELEEKKQNENYIQALYKCDNCALIFEYSIHLQNHMRLHCETRGNYECWICKMRFRSKGTLKAHTSKHSTRFICQICNYRTNNRRHLLNHLEWHAGFTYPCTLCGRIYNKRDSLAAHMRCHKQKETKEEYKCEQCGKVYGTKDKLVQHEYLHMETRIYSCSVCNKTFTSKTNLNLHAKCHMEKTGEFYCVECDMAFKSEHVLNFHLKKSSKHKDPSLFRICCKLCPKRFESQEQLTSHIQSSHDRIAKLSCEICGARYVTQQGLNFHKRKAHQGYVPPLKHACPTCDKHFATSALLKNHSRTHTGERPFKCSLCSWKFTQQSSLRTHIRLKHLKIKRNVDKKEIKVENSTSSSSSSCNILQPIELHGVTLSEQADNIVIITNVPSLQYANLSTPSYT